MKKGVGIGLWLTGLIVLSSLCVWQSHRLNWKTEIIKTLDQLYSVDPGDNVFDLPRLETLAGEPRPLAYGSVNGTFLFDREIALGPKTQDGKAGFHILTPLKLTQGGIILVNRGFRETATLDPARCACRLPAGEVQVSGILRRPDDVNRFTPPNSPVHDHWTHADIGAIAQARDLQDVLSLVLYASQTSPALTDTQMSKTRWYPRNEHRNYMLFWGVLAAIWGGGGLGLYLKQRKTSHPTRRRPGM